MEKSEVINNLYAIRAGLSAISVNYDRMMAKKTEIQEKKRCFLEEKTSLGYADVYLRENEKRAEEDEEEKENLVAERAKLQLELQEEELRITPSKIKENFAVKKEFKEYCKKNRHIDFWNFFLTWSWWGLGDLAIWFICAITLPIIVFYKNGGNDPVSKLLFIPGAVLYPLILTVIFTIRCRLDKKRLTKDYVEYHQREHKSILRKIENCDNRIANLDNSIKSGVDYKQHLLERVDRNKQRTTEIEESHASYIAAASAFIVGYAKENQRIKNALIRAYGSFLDVSDWNNIDLIIYYLNTNRADSMKEALQLVDRQRQMNALADAICSAGDAISNTISEGFSAMQASLSVHFENLSTQIGRVESGIEEIGIQNAANAAMISTQISELMQANEIQSAFMEKASRGVDKLVEDMRKSDWELKVEIEQR